MARLKAGVKPTPHNERQAAYRENLVRSGGKRITAELGPEGAEALAAIMANEGMSLKEALTVALTGFALKYKK